MAELSRTQKALHDFLAAFSPAKSDGTPDVQKPVEDLEQFWREKGTLGTPVEMFSHLMKKQVQDGTISAGRAEVLTRTFKDSFAPEHSTGYLAKHREPIVEALAQLYVERVKPKNTVWRIEGDISNLGGLNRAMLASAEELKTNDLDAFNAMLTKHGISRDDDQAVAKLGRAMADRVMHTICHITNEHLQNKAQVIPVRKGGDEISFIAVTPKGVSGSALQDALHQTQTDVAQFVISTGLIIPHTKYPGERRRSGVGIGLHAVDMTLYGRDEQQQLIAQGIPRSKEAYLRALHRSEPLEINVPDMKQLDAMLDVFPAPTPINNTLRLGHIEPGRLVEDNRKLKKLFKTLESTGDVPLNDAEKKAAIAVHALVRKNDFVTSLPQFENMQEDQLPGFLMKYGSRGGKLKLVNIDFSNVAGGNELSEDVGNAMLRKFRDVVLTSMNKAGLCEYTEGLAVRPGGKFALIVPSSVSDDQIAKLALELKQNLDSATDKPLQLTPRQIQDVRENIGAREKLQDVYGAKGEKLQDSSGALSIKVSDIVNPKTRLQGASVVMTYTKEPITFDKTLGDQLRPLEADAEKRQKQIATYMEQASFTSRVNGNSKNTGITR